MTASTSVAAVNSELETGWKTARRYFHPVLDPGPSVAFHAPSITLVFSFDVHFAYGAGYTRV